MLLVLTTKRIDQEQKIQSTGMGKRSTATTPRKNVTAHESATVIGPQA